MTGLPFWEMPDHLTVGGVPYPIDTDFRVGIRIRQILWEPYAAARPAVLLDAVSRLLFSDGIPTGMDGMELLCAVVWYLLDGRVERERILRRLSGASDRAARLCAGMEEGDAVFSYLWDMPALYAAFHAVYHMDLLAAQMHLWQFDALFASLPADCSLSRTMALRACPLSSAEDDAARAALAAQKCIVGIPDADTLHRLIRSCAQ